MRRAFELRQQKAALLEQAKQIHDKAEAEDRSKSEAERAEFDGKIKEAEALEARAVEAERIGALHAAADSGERRSAPLLPHNDPANTRNGRHGYSLLKAMRQDLDARTGRGRLDGIEAETHEELAKTKRSYSKKGPQGIMVPLDLPVSAREAARQGFEVRTGVLNTTTGTGSIPTVLAPTLIDLLRNRMVTQLAGARVMSNMEGLFAIPRQNAAGTAYWVAEGAAPTASNQTIDQVTFSPKTCGAFTDYTRRFLEESNQDAEDFVRNDLTAVVARGVDLAALDGSGTSNQPLGILQNTAISVTALGTNGAAPTYAALVAMEEALAVANADIGQLKYLVNGKGRAALKTTLKVSGSNFPIYLWDDGPVLPNGAPTGIVNGYQALTTNQLPANLTKGTGTNLSPIIFGNWSDLIIALWSGLDVVIDPYTGSSTGNVRVVVLQDADVNVRHPESFNNIVDMIAS